MIYIISCNISKYLSLILYKVYYDIMKTLFLTAAILLTFNLYGQKLGSYTDVPSIATILCMKDTATQISSLEEVCFFTDSCYVIDRDDYVYSLKVYYDKHMNLTGHGLPYDFLDELKFEGEKIISKEKSLDPRFSFVIKTQVGANAWWQNFYLISKGGNVIVWTRGTEIETGDFRYVVYYKKGLLTNDEKQFIRENIDLN